jgi:hypothetical protein
MNRILVKTLAAALGSLLSCVVFATDPQYDIIITKSLQELDVMQGDQIVKQYRIAYGIGGNGPKRQIGDKRRRSGFIKSLI